MSSNNGSNWQEFIVAGPATDYTFTGLDPSKAYKWNVMTLCDANGTFMSTWSSTVYVTTFGLRSEESIDNDLSQSTIDESHHIYPNPTSGNIHYVVQLQEATEATIEIINATGSIVMNENYFLEKGENDLKIDLSNLSPGCYFIRVKRDDIVWIDKLMKQ